MTHNITKEPVIRFNGYTDAWEQRKFSEVLSIAVPNNTLSRANLTFDKREIKNVHYGDILVKFNSILDVQNDDIPYINDTEGKDYTRYFLKDGDIIFADTAEDETTGKALEINNLGEKSIVSGLHTIIARSNEPFGPFFLGYYLNSNSYHQQVVKLLQGIKVLSISKSNLVKTELKYPDNTEEQSKIGNFFKQLDDNITLQERELGLLKEQKQGFLQKMFPKQNEKFPELRFKGFTDAWEQRKLGEEFEKVNERNDGTFNKNHWISVAKMYFQDPEKVQSNNIDTRTYVMRNGDIAFEGHPNSEYKFGRFVANDIGSGVVSELFPIYRHIVDYDNFYWKNAIQLERIMAPIFAKSITSSGNSSNKLDPAHFLRQKIRVPIIEEQTKIGDFFKQLDETITLQEQKLEALKNIKKSFLQKMFV